MNFREEYKTEAQALTPSAEQCERIRAGVMKKLAENASEVPRAAKKKKPLFVKIAAVSGTVVCAAAVMIVVFAGLRHGIFPESADNAAGGNFASHEQYFGNANEPNAPDYNDDRIGNTSESLNGGTPGVTQSPSAAGSYDTPGAAGSGFGNLPSLSQDPASPSDTGTGKPSDEPPSSEPHLWFSEDKSVCEFTVNGKTTVYRMYEGYTIGEMTYEPVSAESNLGKELFVHFDNDIMVIFYNDGTVFGTYIK